MVAVRKKPNLIRSFDYLRCHQSQSRLLIGSVLSLYCNLISSFGIKINVEVCQRRHFSPPVVARLNNVADLTTLYTISNAINSSPAHKIVSRHSDNIVPSLSKAWNTACFVAERFSFVYIIVELDLEKLS